MKKMKTLIIETIALGLMFWGLIGAFAVLQALQEGREADKAAAEWEQSKLPIGDQP